MPLFIFLFLSNGCSVVERNSIELDENDRGSRIILENASTEPLVALPSSSTGQDDDPDSSRRLGDLSLDQIVDLALRNNRRLLSSLEGVASSDLSLTAEQARFETRVAPRNDLGVVGGSGRDSDLAYGLGLSIERRLDYGTILGLTPSIETFGERQRAAVGFDITQPLLRNFGPETNLDGVTSAMSGLRRSQRAAYQTQVSTVLGAVNAVYRIVRQEELIKLNEASAKRLRRHAAAVRAKLAIGGASRIDLTRAELALSQAEDILVSARQGRDQAIDALKIFLALDLDDEISVDAPADFIDIDLDETFAVELAGEQRIELEQAQDDIEESRRRVRLASRRLLPGLDLVASYTRFDDGQDVEESFDLAEDVWSAGLRVTTDLSRTVERTALARARIALVESERRVRETEDFIAEDARQALRSLSESKGRIAIQKRRIEDAKRQLELAKVKFRYGFADNFDLIDAETQLARAESDLSLVTINHRTGAYQTSAALGILIPRSPDVANRLGSRGAARLPTYDCPVCVDGLPKPAR